jgi:hypothetical protein
MADGRAMSRRRINGIYQGEAGIDWDAQPLGRQSDISLARQLGVEAMAVSHARNSRGIAEQMLTCLAAADLGAFSLSSGGGVWVREDNEEGACVGG